MNISDIYNKIKWLLATKLDVPESSISLNARFKSDLGLLNQEVNLLLYHLENLYNIKFSDGIETELSQIDQIVLEVQKALEEKWHKKKSA